MPSTKASVRCVAKGLGFGAWCFTGARMLALGASQINNGPGRGCDWNCRPGRRGPGALASGRRVATACCRRNSPARGQRSQNCAAVPITPPRRHTILSRPAVRLTRDKVSSRIDRESVWGAEHIGRRAGLERHCDSLGTGRRSRQDGEVGQHGSLHCVRNARGRK